MGVPRAEDAFNDTYINESTNERMIQNYYLCKSNCLGSDGRPNDMFSNDGDPKRYRKITFGLYFIQKLII